MTDSEFFKFDQEQWFTEFVEHDFSKNVDGTNVHAEFFEFDDVPL